MGWKTLQTLNYGPTGGQRNPDYQARRFPAVALGRKATAANAKPQLQPVVMPGGSIRIPAPLEWPCGLKPSRGVIVGNILHRQKYSGPLYDDKTMEDTKGLFEAMKKPDLLSGPSP